MPTQVSSKSKQEAKLAYARFPLCLGQFPLPPIIEVYSQGRKLAAEPQTCSVHTRIFMFLSWLPKECAVSHENSDELLLLENEIWTTPLILLWQWSAEQNEQGSPLTGHGLSRVTVACFTYLFYLPEASEQVPPGVEEGPSAGSLGLCAHPGSRVWLATLILLPDPTGVSRKPWPPLGLSFLIS